MIALRILEVKKFMGHLLNMDTFDYMYLQKAEICMRNSITIDGKLNRDYLIGEEAEQKNELTRWGDIKPLIYELIKGHRTPQSIYIVMKAEPEDTIHISGEAVSFYMNIRFIHSELQLVSGTAYSSFITDKTAEHMWDEYLEKYLHEKMIAFESC